MPFWKRKLKPVELTDALIEGAPYNGTPLTRTSINILEVELAKLEAALSLERKEEQDGKTNTSAHGSPH